MKKYHFRISLVLLTALLALQGAAYADTVEGRIADADSESLAVVVYDAQGQPYPNHLSLKVDERTRYQGVRSPEELVPDDAVSVDVSQEESGMWRADRVTLFQQINARPATKKTPSGMSGLLGNPVMRGALLGAATGAIAASGSKGKAGKGALIGAGVGALLGGLMGGGSDSSQEQS